MKYCPECGAALKDNAVYCTNCGARIDPRKVVHIPQDRILDTSEKEKKKKTFRFDDDTQVILPRTKQDYIRELQHETDEKAREKPPKKKKERQESYEEILPEDEKEHSLGPFFVIALVISIAVAGFAAFMIPYTITHHQAKVENATQESEAKKANDYMIATSSSVELTNGDLKDLTRDQLRIAKYEIYARHGYIFHNTALKDYFEQKHWYTTRIAQSDATTNRHQVYRRLSTIEKGNIAFINKYGKSKGWNLQ